MRPAPVSPALLLASALLLLLLVSRSAAASPSDGPSGGRFARASPLRWGKRSEILRWGKREPLRWGKRSVSDEDYLVRASISSKIYVFESHLHFLFILIALLLECRLRWRRPRRRGTPG